MLAILTRTPTTDSTLLPESVIPKLTLSVLVENVVMNVVVVASQHHSDSEVIVDKFVVVDLAVSGLHERHTGILVVVHEVIYRQTEKKRKSYVRPKTRISEV